MRGAAVALGLLVSLDATAQARAGNMAEAYARAAKVLDANLAGAILNAQVAPHWIEGGQRFWYRRDGTAGPEWVIVESATGGRSPAFDAARLRKAAKADTLAVIVLNRETVTLSVAGGTMRCTLADYRCAPEATPPAAPGVLREKDDRWGVAVRGHDLYFRRRGNETGIPLTRDGSAHFAYGAMPGTALFAVPTMRKGGPALPYGVSWSPDGAWLIGTRVDERHVASYPFVEWVPQDGSFRPKMWTPRIPLLGEVPGIQEAFAINPASGRKTVLKLPEGWTFQVPALEWAADGRHVFGLAATRSNRRIALVRSDLATGETRLVVQEATTTMATFNAFIYSPPNVRVLERSREALWFSQRDGWGRIALHDLETGRLKRTLTTGPGAVRDIVAVDEIGRRLFYTAGGADTASDPYHVRLHVVSLDGGSPRRLTPEEAVHVVALSPNGDAAPGSAADAGVSPDGRWIVESFSTIDQAPVSVLRATEDGRVIATLETANVGAIEAAGWRKPVRVRLMAADGRTPIWSTVYFPPDMQPGRKYPVIDAIYGGPQIFNAPADFPNAVATLNPISRASLAALGFVVVTIDGRGTPGRSKPFNDASYGGAFAEPELADHVAGIRQLAARFGSLDLDRVGTYGHSFGGYTSARAILTYPDFYKVAVSSAGPHNFQGFYPVESWFGPADYGRGEKMRPSPTAVPDSYAKLDSTRYASKLKGRLLLVYGDMDENALPAVTLQLVDALIKANKRYDLLYLPNRDHQFFRTDAYYTQRMWDYFVEHLLDREPPADFTLTLGRR